MASKRRNMFYQNMKQEKPENTCNLPSFCDSPYLGAAMGGKAIQARRGHSPSELLRRRDIGQPFRVPNQYSAFFYLWKELFHVGKRQSGTGVIRAAVQREIDSVLYPDGGSNFPRSPGVDVGVSSNSSTRRDTDVHWRRSIN
ncbi:hypothetical protein AAG570_001954 [Ranatra chinensis]|uniref:Uncharacterized protein n=1 Tax=Ranatra chinensis TaxID=642074 RepID=A0ABD0YY95_9HEMI